VVFTAIALVVAGSDIMLPWHPYAWLGFWAAGYEGNLVVTYVDPSAAREGVRLGEHIDLKGMPPPDRFSLQHLIMPSRSMPLPLTSGHTLTIAGQTIHRTAADNVTVVIEVLALLAYILIAAALVLLRPTPATWAFYVFSYGFCVFAAMPTRGRSPSRWSSRNSKA
jgi:hypothetical protein